MPNKQTAVSYELEQTDTTNLEHEVVVALSDADISSKELQQLLERTEQAILEADAKAAIARGQAYDPAACPDPAAARQMLEDAIFRANRLLTVKPRLQLRIERVVAAEEHRGWVADYERLKVKVEAAAEQFAAEYPEHVSGIVALVAENETLTQLISELHGRCPPGEPRRLKTPSILTELRLPDLDGRVVWPPEQRIDPALFAPAPYDPRFSPEWWQVAEEAQRQREQAEAKQLERERRGRAEFYGQVPPAVPAE
jgi:hypothetical protein